MPELNRVQIDCLKRVRSSQTPTEANMENEVRTIADLCAGDIVAIECRNGDVMSIGLVLRRGSTAIDSADVAVQYRDGSMELQNIGNATRFHKVGHAGLSGYFPVDANKRILK